VKAGGKQSAGFLLGSFLNPEDGGDVPPKCRLTFNGLHGIISQKTELFKFLTALSVIKISVDIILHGPYAKIHFPPSGVSSDT
jgi:hypothetical protein